MIKRVVFLSVNEKILKLCRIASYKKKLAASPANRLRRVDFG